MEKQEKLLDYLEGLESMLINEKMILGTIICAQDDLENISAKIKEAGYVLFETQSGSVEKFKKTFAENEKVLIIVKDGKYIIDEKDIENLPRGIVVVLFSKEEYENSQDYQKIGVSFCNLLS